MGDLSTALRLWQPVTLSLLRFVTGLLFLEHGTGKLLGWPALPMFAHMAHLSPMLLASGVLELVGGALVCIGLFTRWSAFILSGEMAVGYFMVHAPHSVFPAVNNGDGAILYCFIFLYLFVAGGGPISLDRLLFGPRDALATPTSSALSV